MLYKGAAVEADGVIAEAAAAAAIGTESPGKNYRTCFESSRRHAA
jgi:hypothetical protein